MITKKYAKNRVKSAVFGCFFGIMGLIAGLGGAIGVATPVYAEPVEATTTETTEERQVVTEAATPVAGASCEDSLGALGWLVCPTTGKIAEAVDWLYEKIEGILVINPVEMKDGSPIYEIWKYFRGVTNIVFIIFLLVMVYSQLTGVGISNYGLKKMLPKLIIAAVLVNLSFVICQLAVDVSNIVGNSLRGVFSAIEETAFTGMTVSDSLYISMHDMYGALAGGSVLAVGAGVVAFETGAIWMLIPVALGAIVAVASGLITIALRQAVVALLMMIAPLAIVAYILPNTEIWFKKWRQLLTKMLVFYPMFSLLFGASQLAGFAIIASASDGFGVMLGIAVQIFPLFFSWSLMKMSGTFLSSINAKITTLAARPLAANQSWADSHREATRMKYLASNKAYLPSLRLRQYLSDRKIHREEETKENAELVKNRGLAYSAMRNYKDWDKGVLDGDGETAYANQARNMRYQRVIQRHKNNMNEGYAARVQAGTLQYARLSALDLANVNASDFLKAEVARGELIDYRNAMGYHKRMEDAINAHFDEENEGRANYKRHAIDDRATATMRYEEIKQIMNDNALDAQYAAASAAYAYDTQAKIISSKFQKYFELTPPTRDVRYRLEEFSKFAEQAADGTFKSKAVDNIDAIVSGLRVLNQRGDTDFLKDILDDVLDSKYGGLTLGTHASQALASFLMFEVKDNDPWLRRFGKYINLQTAAVYDNNVRKKQEVDYEEYLKGYYYEPGAEHIPENRQYPKKNMIKLMEGTSLDNVERTAFDNINNSLKKAYGYDEKNPDKPWDVEGWMKKREEMQTAIEPQFLSAVLKYLSGSEQMNSAVKFWTGYDSKQKKDENGKVMTDENGEPIYSLTPVWNEGFGDKKEKVRKFFQRKTKDYLKDQTPIQIIQMRTDVRDAIAKHMLDAWQNDAFNEEKDENGVGVNAMAHMAEYEAARKAIEDEYQGELSDAQKKELAGRLKELDMDFAGREVRSILGPNGTLEQIWNTRHSSASNSAKAWNRNWLLLNNEKKMEKEVNAYRRLREKKLQEELLNKGSDTEEQRPGRIYGESFMKDCVNQVEKLWDDHSDDDAQDFYKTALDFIDSKVGARSLMRREFERRVVDERRADSNLSMKTLLEELFDNPDMYPDA